MSSALDRLKVYIKSSSPIVVVETLEEMRALEVARAAASDLDLAEDIDALRAWAADRARPSTTPETSRAAAAQLA